jgi:hypothetical protein
MYAVYWERLQVWTLEGHADLPIEQWVSEEDEVAIYHEEVAP